MLGGAAHFLVAFYAIHDKICEVLPHAIKTLLIKHLKNGVLIYAKNR